MTMSLEPGSRIGRIRIDGLIGAGGMGEVYRGWDERLERRVAVKVIRPRKLVHEAARMRFLREAQLLSKLDHPNICRIHDVIEEDSASYLVLEHIEGRTLRQAFPEIDAAAAVRIAGTVARVLAFAHERNIIHRDLKPDNIMLTADGEVKVLDFGLARLVEDEDSRPVAAGEDDDTVIVDPGETVEMTSIDWDRTSAGTLIGTLHYMSPEQARGVPVAAASDVYSLGIVFYELLRRGGSPYGPTPSSTDLLAKVRRAEVDLSGLDDPEAARLIGRLTAADPVQRPAAAEAARELGHLAARPERRRRKVMIAAAVALVVILGAAMAMLARRAVERPLFTTPGERKIAVLPFRNETDQRGNEWMELGLMDMVMQGLGGTRAVRIVPAEDVLKALKNASLERGAEITPQLRARLLDMLDADTLLAAVVHAGGESDAKFTIRYRLLLRDREESPREIEAPAATDAANELAARVARRVDPKAHSVDIRDRYSFDDFANVAYAIGMQEMLGKGPRAAAHYFTVCIDRDPEFAWARLQLARCRIAGAELAGVDGLLNDAERHARSKGDRKLVSAVMATRSDNAIDRGDYAAAERFARASLATASALGDLELLGRAQRILGVVNWRRQRLDEAERWYLSSGETFTKARNLAEQARISNNLGALALERKDLDKAKLHLTRALTLSERLGDGVLMSKAIGNLALHSLYRGDPDSAERYLAREIELARRSGIRTDELNALLNLGLAKYMRGREAEAVAVTEQGCALAISMRIPFAEAIARVNLGFAHTAAGRLDAADRELDRADAIRTKLGSPQVDHLAETIRAYWLVRTGDLAAAERALSAAERLGRSKNTWAIRARLLYERGQYPAAAEAMRRAQTLRELWMPTDQRLLEAVEEAARSGKPSRRAFEAAAEG
jgi:tetratricopeptide (TPR) repeat protein